MKENRTLNYRKYQDAVMNENVVGLLIKAVDTLRLTSEDTEVIEDIEAVLKKFETDEVCPRCGERLYISDLEQYDYVCYECDENF